METRTEIEKGRTRPRIEPVGPVSANGVSESANKYPPLCRVCAKQSHTFRSAGHPDDGVRFICGMMKDAMNNGFGLYSCSYFKRTEIAGVIDADQQNAYLLARGRV